MCLLHNFMQSSLCILTKEQIRIVKFNADFLATMLKINTQIPTGCRNNAQSTQSQSPAILSQSHLGNQKPNPYNGENKSGGTHANHDKGKKSGKITYFRINRASFGTAFAIVQQKRHPAPMPCRAAHKGRYAAHTARHIFAVQRHKASS